MTTAAIQPRLCPRCRERPRRVFSTGRVGAYCGPCDRGQMRAWEAAHREQDLERMRAYYIAHREQSRTSCRAWRAAHKDEMRAYAARYHAAHREQRRAYDAAWDTAHKDEVREYNHRPERIAKAREIGHKRRVRLGDKPGVTDRDLWRLLKRYGWKCAYCGHVSLRLDRPWPALTLDHVIPLARGGRHAIGNVLPACRRCNFSKGKKLLIEWRSQQQASVRKAA